MWYFAWILSTGLAVMLSVVCGIWLERQLTSKQEEPKEQLF